MLSSSPMAAGRTTIHTFTAKSIPVLFRSGKINHARKLFDEMAEKNIISYSSMIYGYSSHGLYIESFDLFSQLQKTEIRPNSFTFVALLLAPVGMRDLRLGETIHGRIVRSGLETNSFVMTSLVDFYAKCGSVVNAYRLFKEMAEPSLVTCNAMISGLVHNDLFEEALLLFKRLWASGLVPNCVTMMSVTQGCIGYDSFRLCESMHGYIIKSGLDSDVSVTNSVFDMYLNWGNLGICREFFRKMVVLDIVSWTSMMGILLEEERPNEALSIFIRMRDSGISPDMITMVHVITACALRGDLRRGRSVHNQILTRGIGLELPIINSLITMYSKCEDLESARSLFGPMVDKSLVSWTAMISGYLHNGQHSEGLGLLNRMRREENYNIDSVTLVSLVASSSELASLNLCNQLHTYGFKLGLVQKMQVQNSLVSAYGKCGHADLAFKLFEEMIHRDSISWNAMISSYGINGKGEDAVSLFLDMEKCGEETDSFTYLGVLNACSHSGLVDAGLSIFEMMVREKRINPRREHLGCVVDMLSRAGRLAEAREFVNSMEEAGENVWEALLAGCLRNGEVGLAEVAADRLFQMRSGNSGHVVLLSNVYASVGRFQKAEVLRSRELKGLLKSPGLSVIDGRPCDVGKREQTFTCF